MEYQQRKQQRLRGEKDQKDQKGQLPKKGQQPGKGQHLQQEKEGRALGLTETSTPSTTTSKEPAEELPEKKPRVL